MNTGHHPNGFTQKNIETFSAQLKELGFDYDWSKMIATSDPSFYKWTQWIFKKLYEAGYAKRIEMPVNWCEELGTVLSNDEVIDGKSERGGYPVVKKNMMQWVIDQPAFAEKLLEGLNEIDWPESTKEIQRNWIGKSTGVEVDFQLVGGGEFSIYTTCIETIYGITFMVLAPDGKIVQSLMDRVQNKEAVQSYIDESVKKSDMDRTELNKTKSGCRLEGVYAINPVNGKQVPVFIGDFVLASYGTGAVMAVPSHDQRDFEYAQVHNIPMIQVIDGADVSEHAFEAGLSGQGLQAHQLRRVHRPDGGGGQGGHHLQAGKGRRGQKKGQLPFPGVDLRPSEILGRAGSLRVHRRRENLLPARR